jgi:hypothetical protein
MNQVRNRFLPPLQGGRLFDRYLGLKPQAAVATLWRALAIGPDQAKKLAATKALRSRAESYSPFGTRITNHQSSTNRYVVPTFI